MTSSRIPEARKKLLDIADELYKEGAIAMADDIRTIVEVLMFRKPRKTGGTTARAAYMTKTVKAQIRKYFKEHPTARPGAIAKRFNTDPKRTKALLEGGK